MPQDDGTAVATLETRPFEITEETNGTESNTAVRIVTFNGNERVQG